LIENIARSAKKSFNLASGRKKICPPLL